MSGDGMGLTPLWVRDGAHPTLGAGWGLTPLWVRDADDGHVEHIRVRAKHRLKGADAQGPMNAHPHTHTRYTPTHKQTPMHQSDTRTHTAHTTQM